MGFETRNEMRIVSNKSPILTLIAVRNKEKQLTKILTPACNKEVNGLFISSEYNYNSDGTLNSRIMNSNKQNTFKRTIFYTYIKGA